jgi:hypothetical protein
MGEVSKMGPRVMSKCFLIAPTKNPTKEVITEIIHVIRCLELIFYEVNSIIVESNSDGNFDCQKYLNSAEAITHLQLGSIKLKFNNRVNQIGYARNAGLSVIEPGQDDYIAFMDTGVANHALTVADMASCFSRTDWDAITANQYGRYYDIWALRVYGWSDSDCWAAYKQYAPLLGEKSALDLTVGSKQVVIPETSDWIAVQSAFGGFGFFKAGIYKTRRFETDTDGSGVGWDKFFEIGDRVFINPRLRNGGDPRHLVIP